MRVVHITSDYLDSRHGGVELHVYHLSKALLDMGIDSTIVRVSPERSQFEAPPDVPFVHVHGPAGRTLHRMPGAMPGHFAPELTRRVIQNLSGPMASRRIDGDGSVVIHQHDFLGNVVLTKILGARHPVVWTNHLGEYLLLRRSRVGRLAIRQMTRHYAHAFAPSRELADIPAMGTRVTYLPNAVDRSLFSPVSTEARSSARHNNGLADGDLVVLIPRRWAPTKGVLFAVNALRRLTPDELDRNLTVVFVGAGVSEYPDYAADVQSVIEQLPHRSLVIPHATPVEMASIYQASDITLVPSFLEATSLSALEAMSTGSTVIASETGGLAELIDDGVNGFLHPPGDESALARSIARVAAMPRSEVSRIEASAFDTANSHSWTAMADTVAEVYRRVLGGRL